MLDAFIVIAALATVVTAVTFYYRSLGEHKPEGPDFRHDGKLHMIFPE